MTRNGRSGASNANGHGSPDDVRAMCVRFTSPRSVDDATLIHFVSGKPRLADSWKWVKTSSDDVFVQLRLSTDAIPSTIWTALKPFAGVQLDLTHGDPTAEQLRRTIEAARAKGLKVALRVSAPNAQLLRHLVSSVSVCLVQVTDDSNLVRHILADHAYTKSYHTLHSGTIYFKTRTHITRVYDDEPPSAHLTMFDLQRASSPLGELPRSPSMIIPSRRNSFSPAVHFEIQGDSQPTQRWTPDEVEYWGWSLLVASITIFIGGCYLVLKPPGSDVKITSYADYEDEVGLPIQGYYPAMMVLVFAVGWVWSIVSWMGMKFFRHASGSRAAM